MKSGSLYATGRDVSPVLLTQQDGVQRETLWRFLSDQDPGAEVAVLVDGAGGKSRVSPAAGGSYWRMGIRHPARSDGPDHWHLGHRKDLVQFDFDKTACRGCHHVRGGPSPMIGQFRSSFLPLSADQPFYLMKQNRPSSCPQS